jgi:hypothetical protein
VYLRGYGDDHDLNEPQAQAAGAAVACEVFTHMWHDFMQESEGCGSGTKMEEAVTVHLFFFRLLSSVCAQGISRCC